MGACTQPGSFFIVSEYLVGGDVEALLQSDKKISLFRRLLMAKVCDSSSGAFPTLNFLLGRCNGDELASSLQSSLHSPRLKNFESLDR